MGRIASEQDPRLLRQLLDMPWAFLGFALWRAWVSLTYANPSIPMPVNSLAGQFSYDVVLAVACLVVAFMSRHLMPLSAKRLAYVLIAVLLAFSVCSNTAAVMQPSLAHILVIPATVAGGVGSALLILIWCEIYSCLHPTYLALYYSLSLMGGVGLTYLLAGFKDQYLYGILAVLPMLSAALAWRSYRRYIPVEDRPEPSSRMLIPWKFFLILALFEFIGRYNSAHLGSDYASLIGSHSTWTTLIGGFILFLWVWRFSNRLPLSVLYRAPTLIICCGLLVVPLFGLGGNVVGSFCTAVGLMLFNSVVFLFLCDIARRFGVSALLLFGIEESLLLVGWTGKGAAGVLDGFGHFGAIGPTMGALFAAITIAIVTVFVLNEKEIGQRWGIAFLGKRSNEENAQSRLIRRCEEVASTKHLTPRELEVMELLAQGKSLSAVARELIIAEGTAKAHTRHIYEKLGISTRQELLDLLYAE